MAITLGSTGLIFNDNTVQTDTLTDYGAVISITSFTGGGTYTVPAGCVTMFVRVQGGGGGAAGYSESGGAGGYSETLIDVAGAGLTPGASTIAVTVGGGGGGVGYYAAAGQGGTSSFGGYCAATGGYGANQNYTHTGGHSGVGSGGIVNLYQGAGCGHANSHQHSGSARGGASYFGGCYGTRHSGGEQIGPGAPGAGAPGGVTDSGQNGSGHVGSSGLVVVYAYK